MSTRFEEIKQQMFEMYEKMWIRVDKELPDTCEPCYVKVLDQGHTIVTMLTYNPMLGVWVDDDDFEYYYSAKITHWMYAITP